MRGEISSIRTNNSPDETREKIDAIVARNQELERIDYGLSADANIWPEIIALFFSNNEWVGPSIVLRLLTHRPDELKNERNNKHVACAFPNRPMKKARLES